MFKHTSIKFRHFLILFIFQYSFSSDVITTNYPTASRQFLLLNWLQDKLEDEMKKESYKHYVEQEKLKRKPITR